MQTDDYKSVIALKLQPYFEMLKHQSTRLSTEEWVALVNRTAVNISNSPEQYMGSELLSSEMLPQVIADVFSGFLLTFEGSTKDSTLYAS